MYDPRTATIPAKKLIGKFIRTSLINDRTFELWHGFMPERKNVPNKVTDELISVQVYDEGIDFHNFTPLTEWTKWAAVEVTDHAHIPPGMCPMTLPGGMYAVFIHTGPPSRFRETFQFIFGEWLPCSEFELAPGPHFEVMGAKYKNNEPESEEEIWIPIRLKT